MIQFIKYRGLVVLSSLIFIVTFLIAGFLSYQRSGKVFMYSIDFTGGTQVLLKSNVPVSIDVLRTALQEKGWSNADIRLFGNNEFLIKVQEFSNDTKGLGESIRQAIQNTIIGSEVVVLQSEAVGPGIGESLRIRSFKAIILSLILMLLYIAFRFWSFSFGIGAVVALIHDAIVMLAVLYFFDKEISMNIIGAILAVLGYSINDTIVIFSRIREDIARKGKENLDVLVNESINRTLTRTILTSLSTVLPVFAMLFFGGEALYNLSFIIIIGITLGTYSSIYIASPVMLLFDR